MAAPRELIGGDVYRETSADGMIHITGKTFPIKDALREHGGRWTPATKSWRFKAESDLSWLPALVTPIPAEVVIERKNAHLWRCCDQAIATYPDAYGPLCWQCTTHGFYNTGYVGN